jgi:6-phosphogluconolactonase/glucosamine-6-phosphate isomerase/deaminase
VELKQFENTSALDMSLADEVSDRLRQAIQKQGHGFLGFVRW